MSIEDFMKSPLVRWVQLFQPDALTYSKLCDGAFLGKVMQQIDPGANLMGLSVDVTEFRERLQNWDVVITAILSYYQNVLQQYVIMRLPDVIAICKLPYSEVARQEIQRALLLILGCAVQCEQKQLIIEKIKSLDLNDQESIMHSINEVTDCPRNILSVESLGEKLDDPSSVVCSYVMQLLRERQENRSQIQDVSLALEELQMEKETSEQTISGVVSTTPFSPSVAQSKAKNNLNLNGQIRRLQLELDEKVVENQELHEELDQLNWTAEKLRNENVDLIKEASAARAYRDELDIVQEKANLAKKYELENMKLREKLTELDFLRARVKEISSENSLLLESKLDIEEKLSVSEKRAKAMCDLEEQLSLCKHHLEAIAAERDSERRKLHELSEENAHLRLQQMTAQSQNISLEEELKSVRMKSYSSPALSLSDQLSEMATSKLLRLELENQQLRKQMAGNRDDSATLRIQELEKENARLCVKVDALEQTVAEDKRTEAEFKQLNLLQQRSETEGASDVLSQNVRQNGSEEEPEIRNAQDKNEVVSDHLIRNLENENRKLTKEFQSVQSDLAKISVDHRQLMIKHEALVSENSQHIKALEKEKDELDQENIKLKNTVTGLRLVFEKYTDAEKTAVELRVENEKLTKKLAALEVSAAKVSALEQENTCLRIEVECLQLTVENQKNSSTKIVDLEHEKDVMSRQLVHLQSSLESSKLDRMTIITLEHDLAMAIDEKIQLKRHLESAMSELESSQASYSRLELQNEQLQKSVESFETAKKKFDLIQQKNDKLEVENQRLMAGKSALEKENARLRQRGEEQKVRVEELSGKMVGLEAANKELVRNLERSQWLRAMSVHEMESLHEEKEAEYKQPSEQKLDIKKEQQQREDLLAEQVKSMSLSAIPVQVVTPNRTGTSNNSSMNMLSTATDHQDGGACAMDRVRGQGWHSAWDPVNGTLDPDVELRSDIVRLERKNAVLEEENRNLKAIRNQLQTRLSETERQYSVAHSELSSIRGQCHAIQTQLEKLQAESLSLAPKNALLESENSSLHKECADLQSRLSHALDEKQRLSLIKTQQELEIGNTSKQIEHLSAECTQLKNELARLKLELQKLSNEHATVECDLVVFKNKHSELSSEYVRLQNEHFKLKSEHEEVTNEHAELVLNNKITVEEASQLEEQCFQLTKEVEDLSEWKVRNDKLQMEMTSGYSEELVNAKTEITRLQREAEDERKSLERLRAENEKAKSKWSRMIQRQDNLEKDLADAKEQLSESVKENNGLASKCEALSQLQLRLEEENQALMIQLQALMNQNHDLLTQILNSKDHFAEEQKSYLNQLSELRWQKEKLEEKIIEQQRQKDKKKNKGFSAFVKRTFLKDKKIKERNKATNDLALTPRTFSELDLTPRTTDELDLTPSSVNSLVTPPSARQEGHSRNWDSIYTSGSDVPDGDRIRVSQQKQVVMASVPKLSLDGDSGDEQITLEEFLQECNQSPMARKKLLMQKNLSTGRNAGMQRKNSLHRSSLLTLSHPPNTRSSNSVGGSRLFQSELNLFQGSPLSRTSETSYSNFTGNPVREANRERSETLECTVLEAQTTEVTQKIQFSGNQSIKAEDVHQLNEHRKHRRYPSSASSVTTKNSSSRVIVTQADVTLSSSVTNSLQDPVVPRVSKTSVSSGEGSNLSHSSSKQSLNTSCISNSSILAQRTNFSDVNNLLRTDEPADNRVKTGFKKDNKHNLVESCACHNGTSPSNGDFRERAASSSSSSVNSRRRRPIPFIDEAEHEEVTYRESNVCI